VAAIFPGDFRGTTKYNKAARPCEEAEPPMGTALSAVTDISDAGTHAWKASGPRDFARLIRRARRHSAHVRFLRKGVPAAAVVLIGVLVIVSWFNPLRAVTELPITLDRVVVSGTKITMEAPKLTGFTRDNRAYTVTAEAAAQDFTNPTVLELTGIRGKMEMQNNGNIDLTAVTGLYNTKSELLTLTQYIVLISSQGYEGHLTEASVDVRKNHIVSEKPVEVFMPNGKLNANRMEVAEGGALLRFDGGVTLVLTLNDPAGSKAGKKAPAR
jgi:lipopolysaccharide export system protein LptC